MVRKMPGQRMDGLYAQAAELTSRINDLALQKTEGENTNELLAALEELKSLHEGMASDLAARQAESQRYQGLFAHAPDGHLLTGAQGNILEANAAAAALLNCPARSLAGELLSSFVAPPDRPAFLARLAGLAEVSRIQEWRLHLQPKERGVMQASLSVVALSESGAQRLYWSLRAAAGAGERAAAPVEGPEYYLQLFDALPSLIWRAGLDAQHDFFNQSWLVFTGRTLEEALGEGWVAGVHPDDRERVVSSYREAFGERRPFHLEYRLRHHSGKYCWILEIGQPYANLAGHFAGYIGTCYDLSERKVVEQALRESEAMLKGLLEHAPDAVIVADQAGQIVLANQQAQEMFGYTPQELTGQPVGVLMPEEYRERHKQHVENYLAEPRLRPMGASLSLFGRRKDGQLFPVDITLGPLESSRGPLVLATIRDITAHKQAEAGLLEREQLLATATSAAPMVFFKIDQQGIVQLSLGRSLARLQQNIDPVGKSIFEIYQDVPEIIENYRRALAGESFTTHLPVGERVFDASYAPVQDEAGQITGVVGVAADITEHRSVLNALRKSEQRFHTIFKDAPVGIELVDLDGWIVESNPAFQKLLGYTAAEIRQLTFAELTHPEDVQATHDLLQELMAGKRDDFCLEKRYLRKDGSIVWGQLTMSLFRTDDRQPLYAIGMVEDITAQKQMQAELAEVQRRMIDSGETERLHLAQELHDGPLQDLHGVAYQVNLLRDAIQAESGLQDLAEVNASLKKVIQMLRAMCGELRPPALAPFGLEKALRSHAEQVQELQPELKIMLDVQPDGQLLSERVRLTLFRIYQHLLANVVRHAEAHHVVIHFTFDDNWIRLEIRDDGRGFEVPRRWVQMVRKGHFGLVGAIERAEALGGNLKVRSQPGAGTTIQVIVPRQEVDQVATAAGFPFTAPKG